MKTSRFTEEQIAFALKQAELGTKVDEICRKIGISDATLYKWRQKYGGLGPSELRSGCTWEDGSCWILRIPVLAAQTLNPPIVKLLILSDLHLEFGTFTVPNVDYDVAILAGDVAVPAAKAAHWAARESNFGAKDVVFVPGNHELYGGVLQSAMGDMERASTGSNVHALDCGELVIGGVRFLGCTLWTDFTLAIDTTDGPMSAPPHAMQIAGAAMNDYRSIRINQERPAEPGQPRRRPLRRRLEPQDTLTLHQAHRRWLAGKLAEPFGGATVVVTHHAPHRGSLVTQFASDWCSASYVNELPPEFFKVPVLWVHGHTHTSFDYRAGNCRVVCNPRGYMSGYPKPTPENGAFNPALVLQV